MQLDPIQQWLKEREEEEPSTGRFSSVGRKKIPKRQVIRLSQDDLEDNLSNLVIVPDTSEHSPPYLRVFMETKKKAGKSYRNIAWEEVAGVDSYTDSLIIQGEMAKRIMHMLKQYGKKYRPSQMEIEEDRIYRSSVYCHNVALYAAGAIDCLKEVYPADFFGIYSEKGIKFTDKPQKPPMIVHLMYGKISPKDICEDNSEICPHSFFVLGEFEGELLCFEKREYKPVNFSFLKNAGKNYEARHKLFAKPLFV